MVNSDARNKERALSRIRQLSSAGLPVEPFARAVLDLINDGVPNSPNRVLLAGGDDRIDAYVGSTPEIVTATPLYRHFFVDSPPEVGGIKVQYDAEALKSFLPKQVIWRQEEIALPHFYRADGYNQVYRPLGWDHVLQVVYEENGKFLGYCPIWRTADQKPFSTEDIAFARASAPHIAHGLKVAQLQQQASIERDSFIPLSGWGTGVVLMDDAGKPIAMDATASAMFLQTGVLDGLSANIFRTRDVQDALDYVARTLSNIFDNPDGARAINPPVYRLFHHWSGILLSLRGVSMLGADGREYISVLVERGEGVGVRRRRMIARWGLSRREAEVLRLIGENKTGPEIAILLGISHDTVRKHTSSVFDKLAVESRAAAAGIARELG